MPASLVLVPRAVNFLDDPIFFEIESALMNGGSAGAYEPDEVNLWCYVKVMSVDGSNSTMNEGEFKLPYSPVNKRCQGDISGLMDIRLHTPSVDTLIGGFYSGVLDHVRKVTLMFEDAFGIPLAVPTNLQSSAEFVIVAGGSKYYQGFGDGSDPGYLLASRINREGKKYAKEVRKEQPELINFYKSVDGTVNVEVTFYYKDTSEGYAALQSFNALGGKVNYLTVGWDQLDLDSYVDIGKELAYYKITITGVGANNSVYYHLDDTVGDHDVYLAYHNGMGGIEIARFSGYHVKTMKTTSDKAVRARTANMNWQDGLIDKINAKGTYTTKLVSGYYGRDYVEELAQCVLGEAWLVDKSREQFYKVYIEPDDVVIIDDDDDVHYLEISMTEHYRTTHHNFRY